MFKLNKRVILKCYCYLTILFLALYKQIICNYFASSNNLIKLFICLNLILVDYCLLNENLVSNEPEIIKYFIVACTSEYLSVWELVELLDISQELAIYYIKYLYFGLILIQLGLYQRFPKVIQGFIKFNYILYFSYIFIVSFLDDYNFFYILCILIIIIGSYFSLLTLDHMTVLCTHYIYFITVLEAIKILIGLIHIENINTLRVIINAVVILNYIFIYLR
jgi:hypothetical protein